MRTTAQKPATTPMPVQLSAPEFEVCILPHLALPKRGLKCTLGSCRVFHLILWGLSRGMPGGRPPRDTQDPRVQMVKSLSKDRHHEGKDMCQTLHISRATLYRSLALPD